MSDDNTPEKPGITRFTMSFGGLPNIPDLYGVWPYLYRRAQLSMPPLYGYDGSGPVWQGEQTERPYTISYTRETGLRMQISPEQQEAFQTLADEIAKKAHEHIMQQALMPVALTDQGLTSITNRPANPSPSLTAEHLNAMLKDLDRKDPMVQRGIQRDWVCILNPDVEREIRGLIARGLIHTPPYWESSMQDLSQVMGRRTHVIPGAHQNIMYMDEKIARWLYRDYFAEYDARMAEILGQSNESAYDENTEETDL